MQDRSARRCTSGFRAIGVLGAACLLTVACGGSPEPGGADTGSASATTEAEEAPSSCLEQPMVTLDLDQWRLELQAANSASQTVLNELLTQAGMREAPAEAGEVSIEITDARLGVDGTWDKIVQVRSMYPDGSEALRVALLRPVPGTDNTYCTLGGELSHDKAPGEEPCITDHAGPARELLLIQTIAPDRDSIMVSTAGGWCGTGGDRGDRFTVEYWGDEGGLVRYFRAVAYEAWYTAPLPSSREFTGTVEWAGEWPKSLVHTETIACDADLGVAPGDCVPGETVTRYHYRDGRYELEGDD